MYFFCYFGFVFIFTSRWKLSNSAVIAAILNVTKPQMLFILFHCVKNTIMSLDCNPRVVSQSLSLSPCLFVIHNGSAVVRLTPKHHNCVFSHIMFRETIQTLYKTITLKSVVFFSSLKWFEARSGLFFLLLFVYNFLQQNMNALRHRVNYHKINNVWANL